jgi:hypothetical protein
MAERELASSVLEQPVGGGEKISHRIRGRRMNGSGR